MLPSAAITELRANMGFGNAHSVILAGNTVAGAGSLAKAAVLHSRQVANTASLCIVGIVDPTGAAGVIPGWICDVPDYSSGYRTGMGLPDR